jgi:enoyl-CoA hydratase/carnithine racemase
VKTSVRSIREIVSPFQGCTSIHCRVSQGVALGWIIAALQAASRHEYNFIMDSRQSSSDSATSDVLLEKHGGVVRLTLNRPERRNALSLKLLRELQAAIARIATDVEARVVVIAGAGKIFCAGHDLSEMTGRTKAEYRELFGACSVVMQGLRKLPQPVIARVQGMATAAGCQLAASCDLVVAARDAQFSAPGVKIGLFCTTPMVPLVRAVPAKLALEMLFTGEPISAERALQAGLVNRVVSADQLDAAVQEFCAAILASSPQVIALGKEAFYAQLSDDEATAYERAVEIITDNAMQADAQEGFLAFLEKRPPVWKGK